MAKKRKNSFSKKSYSIGLVALVVLIANGFYAWHQFFKTPKQEDRATFQLSEKSFGNPLMGYAPPAENQEVSSDIHLLYVDITWKELEPKKGKFDWKKIEESNQFKRWKKEGKQIVLRFVLDYPGTTAHADIPDWLKKEVVDPGDVYQTEYGQGFSPNYGDPVLRRYYNKAVKAMGRRWGNDAFVAYIELGALGHWGEWHVQRETGIRSLPPMTIRKDYLTPFQAAFPKAHLLLRRPFKTGIKGNFGLYNDVFGDQQETNIWMEWIQKGGDYDQTDEADALVAMPDAWKSSPIGGELTSAEDMEHLLGNRLELLLEQARKSHLTFLGPKIAEDIGDQGRAYEALLKQMGYRLWIPEVQSIRKKDQITVSLLLKNSGVAPFYQDWPLQLTLFDSEGHQVTQKTVSMQWLELTSDQQQNVKVVFKKLKPGSYQLKVGILSPLTKKPAVHFAMRGLENEVHPQLLTIE